MTAILGISSFYHDSAAALVVDGQIIAAAQEERFSRQKHDSQFPVQSCQYCLQQAGLNVDQLDYVAFYEKPLLKFERLLETYLAYAPRGFRSFRQAMPQWLGKKLYLPREMNRGLGRKFHKRYIFLQHHESHAASAFFPSPFDEAAILTMDGVGEWCTSSIGLGRGNRIQLFREMRFPHSLGLLYSAITQFCGFRVNSGEYKLMGLAPYGQPVFADLLLERIIDLQPDGSFRLDMSYFNYCQGLTMTSSKFHQLMGGPPRVPESDITVREMDLAASMQSIATEVINRCAHTAHQLTGVNQLCLAGGVALNCVVNGQLIQNSPFENIWVQPAAGDAGAALGAAMFVWFQLLDNTRHRELPDRQKGSRLGPCWSRQQIIETLDTHSARYQQYQDLAQLDRRVAQLLAKGFVIGWMQGRAEFGPRALGGRSILGDARNPKMQSLINAKIKYRESFRPFAPAIIRERAKEFFQLSPDADQPYMTSVFQVQPHRRVSEAHRDLHRIDRVTQVRSEIPSVTHLDGTARLQTVDPERSPRFHNLLKEFESQTGCPVLINTSFNVRGEPIVNSPLDAYRCFMVTDMDALVIENFLLLKSDQTLPDEWERQKYLSKYHLD